MSKRDRNGGRFRREKIDMFRWWDNLHEKVDLNLKNEKFNRQKWWQDVPDSSGSSKKCRIKKKHVGFRGLEIEPFWFLCRVTLEKWNKLRLNKKIKSRGKINIMHELLNLVY